MILANSATADNCLGRKCQPLCGQMLWRGSLSGGHEVPKCLALAVLISVQAAPHCFRKRGERAVHCQYSTLLLGRVPVSRDQRHPTPGPMNSHRRDSPQRAQRFAAVSGHMPGLCTLSSANLCTANVCNRRVLREYPQPIPECWDTDDADDTDGGKTIKDMVQNNFPD